MKTYIIYVNGVQRGMIEAKSHNIAELRAIRIFGPSNDKINQYIRVNPWMSYPQAKTFLTSHISVSYTEI